MILTDMHLVYPVVMKRASQPVGAAHGSDLLGAPALAVAGMARSYDILRGQQVRCFTLKRQLAKAQGMQLRLFNAADDGFCAEPSWPAWPPLPSHVYGRRWCMSAGGMA
ncbi:MAG: hypothetical protein ACYCSH_09690 [Acidithiobacillus sp.]